MSGKNSNIWLKEVNNGKKKCFKQIEITCVKLFFIIFKKNIFSLIYFKTEIIIPKFAFTGIPDIYCEFKIF